jgi:choline dehydrogenase-like flavoprotein
MNKKFDCIVVGSGAAGTSVAVPLVEAGCSVLMLDGGREPDAEDRPWPESSFEEIRKTDYAQRQLFLGKDFSSLRVVHEPHTAQMTTGRKKFITEYSEQLPVSKPKNLDILQSLALGGLSESWGAVCDVFSDEELAAVGLPPLEKMHRHYQRVIDRIGVSGARKEFRTQSAIKLDAHGRWIAQGIKKMHQLLKKKNLHFEQPLLAVLTRPQKHRRSIPYNELDFWNNQETAVFRPHLTVSQLLKNPHFQLCKNARVTYFSEEHGVVHVNTQDLTTGRATQFQAKKLVLAAGSINSTRIALKSMNIFDTPVPFLTKAHVIAACIRPGFLGKKDSPRRSSFCQIQGTAYSAENAVASVQLYSYKSLLLYKLLRYLPLPAPLSLRFFAWISPAIVLGDIRFASTIQPTGFLRLEKKKTGDVLRVEYATSTKEKRLHQRSLRAFCEVLLRLGIVPLKIAELNDGSTAHYASGVPHASADEYPLTTDADGKLHQARHVYIADAATWSYLPAKPSTLTIMANADRIGVRLAEGMRTQQ